MVAVRLKDVKNSHLDGELKLFVQYWRTFLCLNGDRK